MTLNKTQENTPKSSSAQLFLGVTFLIILSSCLSALAIFYLTTPDLQTVQSPEASIVESWQKLGIALFIGNLISVIFAGGIALFVVLYSSRKITEPLYRFEKLCEQVGQGEFDVVTVPREKLQFKNLSIAFSSMVSKLHQKRNEQHELIAQMEMQIQDLRGGLNLTGKQRDIVHDLEFALEKLKSNTTIF